ncbi:MAG TPA: endonuclease domain-containing protein [Bacteroidota bacterium]
MTKVFNKPGTKQLRRMLRNNMPVAEVILWSKLKNKQVLGCRFRRQYGVNSYSIDFYCPEIKLAIETDGESHYKDGAEENGQRRQYLIEQYGINFLRFSNDEVRKNLDGVLLAIEEKINELSNEKTVIPPTFR